MDQLRAGIERFRRTGELDTSFLTPDFELQQASSIDNHIAWVWTFRGDKAARLVVYEEQAEALQALGVEA